MVNDQHARSNWGELSYDTWLLNLDISIAEVQAEFDPWLQGLGADDTVRQQVKDEIEATLVLLVLCVPSTREARKRHSAGDGGA